MEPSTARALADLVLVTHVGFAAFVTLGLAAILAGGTAGWRWIRDPWFRGVHLAAIGIVVVQSWLGMICPLTTLEMTLRERAGDPTYSGTFVAHWLQTLLYHEAPPWVFVVGYTAFAAAVVAGWRWFPPRPFRGPLRNSETTREAS